MYPRFTSDTSAHAHTQTHTEFVCELVLGGQHNLFGPIIRSVDIKPGDT